jgi:hypothetical protein
MNEDDGFSHRLLLHAPPDECLTGEEIINSRSSSVKLHNLFLFVNIVHMIFRRYTFSETAEQVLLAEFNRFQILKKKCKRCDYHLL